MAQSIGHLHLEGAPEPIPYFIDPQGETRLLAAFPTPRNHMMFSLPTWEQAGFPTIPRSDWRVFDERQKSIPILDQNGKGACLPHGFATACMSAVLKSGAKFVELCPWFLYTLINRGMDAGSNAGDAIQALTTTGIAPKGIVPYGTIRPKGYNSTAMAAAARFKLLDAVQIKGFDQAVSAILLGFDVTLDVCAGPGFDTNSEGVCRYLMGPNNHEVFMGGGIQRLASGEWVAIGRNSWGTRWGQEGYCYWTEKHLNNSQETWATRRLGPDPEDSEMPPPLARAFIQPMVVI